MARLRDSASTGKTFVALLAALSLQACASPKSAGSPVVAKEPASAGQNVALVGSMSSKIQGLGPATGQGNKLDTEFVLVCPYDGWIIAVTPSTASTLGCAEEYRDGDPPKKEQIPVKTRVSDDAKTVTIESSSETTGWRHLFAEVHLSEVNAPGVGELKADYRVGGDERWYPSTRPVVAIWQPAKEFLQRTNALLAAAEDSIRKIEERSGNAKQ